MNMNVYELRITDGCKDVIEVVCAKRVEEAMENLRGYYKAMYGIYIWMVDFKTRA